MIKTMILYCQFFTRLPFSVEIDEAELRFKKGIVGFSVFGLFIGLVDGLAFLLLSWLMDSLIIGWLGALLFDVFLIGAFHMDGLAEMCDGLFSSRNKERMLEIMKDSRVGTNGVLALIFYYLLMFVPVIIHLDKMEQVYLFRVMVALQIVGKSGIALLFQNMRYAGHTNGLGRLFLGVASWRILICQRLAVMMIYGLLGLKGIIAYFVVVFASFGYRSLVYRKIDGMNGDTLGAFHCISQMLFILILFRG
ncbi:adenosylcobinamide-GDP ribazoletransferase [Enterococcus rotai]